MFDILNQARGKIRQMADILKKPWILPAVLSFLGTSADVFNEDFRPPKLVQLVDVREFIFRFA